MGSGGLSFILCVGLYLSCLTSYGAIVEDPIHEEHLKKRGEGSPFAPPAVLNIPGNLVQNSEFDLGLTDWVTTNDVVHVSAEAILGEQGPPAMLYQSVQTGAGDFVLSFDYHPDLSDDVPTGFAPDTFFASLYFFNDENTFDLANNVFDDALGLLDLDSDGPFNSGGTIEPSTEKGAGWWHFAATFNTPYNFVAVAFELANLNGTAGDSRMFIDNVIMIPEPATGWLVAGALATLLIRRKWRGRA